jgi:hypothetical protein
MSKTLIGLLFILCGFAYGSLAFDDVYDKTLGYLTANHWIKEQTIKSAKKANSALGRKPTILLYALILILIGIYILWNRNI